MKVRKGRFKSLKACLLLSVLGAYLVGCSSGGTKVKENAGAVYFDTDYYAYQYEAVDPTVITVEYDGSQYKLSELPEGVEYDLPSPVYSSETLAFSVGEVEYSVKIPGYVAASDVEWSYNDKISVPEDFSQETVDLSLLKGKITYDDGTEVNVKVDSVDVNYDQDTGNGYIDISDGLNTWRWEVEEEGLNPDKEERWEKKLKREAEKEEKKNEKD